AQHGVRVQSSASPIRVLVDLRAEIDRKSFQSIVRAGAGDLQLAAAAAVRSLPPAPPSGLVVGGHPLRQNAVAFPRVVQLLAIDAYLAADEGCVSPLHFAPHHEQVPIDPSAGTQNHVAVARQYASFDASPGADGAIEDR